MELHGRPRQIFMIVMIMQILINHIDHKNPRSKDLVTTSFSGDQNGGSLNFVG